MAAAVFGLTAVALGYVYAACKGYVYVNGLAAGKYPITGIDVSHYQGEIHWDVLAGQDIDFAYVKATEGSSHTDEKFAENYAGARGAGLKTGAYHFFSFDSAGISQAEHFIRMVEAFEGMMAPAVDVEFYGNKKENPPDADQVEVQLRDYLNRVEQAYGMRPVIYATREAWELYIKGRFEEYPLWIRDIWREPDMGSTTGEYKDEKGWTFWQFTNRGRMEGFSGEEEFVDLNVFYGTGEQWNLWLSETGREVTVPDT